MRPIALMSGTILTLHAAAGARDALAQTSGKSTGPHACDLLSNADIARITGQPNRLSIAPERGELPSLTQCNYYALDVALTPRVTSEVFASTRKQQETGKNVTIESVSGVGDEAYFYVRSRRSTNNVGIIVRAGTYQVALGDLTPADSVAWFKPKLVELAKLAVAKLR